MLYKYRPINKNTIESLINNSLHFSSPSEFNDPFDTNIPVIFDGSSKEQIRDFFLRDKYVVPGFVVQDVFSNENEVLRKKMVDLLNKNDSQHFYRNASMCCFSKNNTNILMWSHYADSHKGIVLGFESYIYRKEDDIQYEYINFDDKKAPFITNSKYPTQQAFPVWPVIYSENKPEEIRYCEIPYDTMIKMLYKSPFWNYEEEMRIIFFNKFVNNNIAFKKESLKEIIFGANSSENDICTIKKVAEKFYENDIKYYKCEIDSKKYCINIVSL